MDLWTCKKKKMRYRHHKHRQHAPSRPVPSGEVSLCGLDTDLDVEAMAKDLARVTRYYLPGGE